MIDNDFDIIGGLLTWGIKYKTSYLLSDNNNLGYLLIDDDVVGFIGDDGSTYYETYVGEPGEYLFFNSDGIRAIKVL